MSDTLPIVTVGSHPVQYRTCSDSTKLTSHDSGEAPGFTTLPLETVGSH